MLDTLGVISREVRFGSCSLVLFIISKGERLVNSKKCGKIC